MIPGAMKPAKEPELPAAGAIVGTSAAIRRVQHLIAMVAPSGGTVLVVGPTGAGKELVAQAIHSQSHRPGRMVALNCAAIPSELLESELFGYEKGAFTGADRQRVGRFEQADKGTLFLDEIGDMPLMLQSKLLRVLETRRIQRVGGREDIALDFRLVCATHRNLEAKVATGEFRADLFYRLNVFPINVPSLAERAEDIPQIVAAMISDRQAAEPEALAPEFDATAMRALAACPWPGNVRELRNVVDRAFVLFPGRTIDARAVRENLLLLRVPEPRSHADEQAEIWAGVADLDGLGKVPLADVPPDPRLQAEAYRHWFDHHSEIDLRGHIRDIEVSLIEAALEKHGGFVSRAAAVLKLRRTTLIEKMKKLMIERPAIVAGEDGLGDS
jgi:sigma-54 specific flagellar transcriptional regulator A